MSWFSMPETLLFCETCKAHIESATYHGTVMEEGADRYSGMGNGFYAVKRLAFCARCKPDHDIVIVRRDHLEHIRLNTDTRTLLDPTSRQQAAQHTADAVIEALAEAARVAAQRTADAVIEALQAAQEARETDEAAKKGVLALDEAQVEADRVRTVAFEAAGGAGDFPSQPMAPERRLPIS